MRLQLHYLAYLYGAVVYKRQNTPPVKYWPYEPVFSLDSTPIKPNRVGKVARKLAIRLHIPLTAHVLRHSFATWMLRGSGNIYVVSKSLGHSQLAQTQIYVLADVEELREALKTLPGLEDW